MGHLLNQREAFAGHNQQEIMKVAKAKKVMRKGYTKDDLKALKAHSKCQDAHRQDLKGNEAHCPRVAGKGPPARDRPRSPALSA